jgi:Metallo-peptidase family M12
MSKPVQSKPVQRNALFALMLLAAPTPAALAQVPESAASVALAQQGGTISLEAALARRLRAAGDEFVLPNVVLGDGTNVSLRLHRFEAVSPSIDVRVGARRSNQIAVAMRAVQHFTGDVIGQPESSVYLGVSERGAAATIDLGPGRERYTLRPVVGLGSQAERLRGLVRGEGRFDRSSGNSAPEVPLCGGVEGERADGGIAGTGAVPHGAMPTIEIAVDTDWEYFNIFGDLTDAAEYVAAVYGAVSAIYQRDVDTRVEVVFTRFFDVPEDLYNDSDPLYPFRDDWNANMTGVQRDLAHFVTGRRNLPYGGVAWLSATCGDFGYCVNGYIIGSFADPVATNPGNWDINVIAHELGHNVASQHTHSYGLDSCNSGQGQRGTIMSYCHINSGASANIDLDFHIVCTDEMEAFIVTSECLEGDCDADGVTDAEAIAAGAVDADADGIPDACQDCDGDGVLDSLAISMALVVDLDADGTPDSCEPDCNGNGVPDSLDIANESSTDAYGNGIPDECEPDCNGNGISDLTEIQLDMSLDRSRNAVLDACEDCDGDGITDLEELDGGLNIFTGCTDSTVRELHPRSGVMLRSLTLDAEVSDLVIAPNGLLYAAAGRKVYPIDRTTMTALAPIINFNGSSGTVRGLAIATDGTLLVSRGPNGVGRHDLNGTFIEWIGGSPNAAPDPRDVAVRADGRILVTCADGRVRQFLANGTATSGFDGSSQQHDYHGVIESPDAAYVIVASRAIGGLVRFNGATGEYLGRFDVQPGSLLSRASGIALAGNGAAYLAPSSASSSTLNGYNIGTGYLERTYRSYGADAGPAQAVIVAPKSASDANGNLIPDECEGSGPDLNGDGTVDATDLAILLGAWGTPAADLDGDGTTSGPDLAILLGAWSA